ncbi:MAG: hypothetical protein WBF53_15650 [Litorimonas sp.]
MTSNIFRIKVCTLLFAGAALSACATTTAEDEERFMADDTRDVEQVVATPVNDIGLDDIEIPAYLAQMTNPYASSPTDCTLIDAEVTRLNQLLGEDLDVPEDEAERREQLALNAGSSAVGSILIPFRGVVRAISGAAKNEREAREAYQRGLVRRGYLRGRAELLECPI